jgi:spermidine synthase
MVGLGGGSLSEYFLRHVPEMQITSVELDPGVIAAAKRFFDINETPRHRILAGDGRVFLMRHKARYDIVMIDAFRGGYVPFHLLTIEFYRILASRLAADGVAVLNLRAGTQLFASSLLTLREIFKSVETYEWSGNAIVLARLAPPLDPAVRLARAQERQARYRFRYDLTKLLADEVKPEIGAGARLLTDDFAPVNLYDSRKN